MNPKLILAALVVIFISCSKADIKKNGCSGPTFSVGWNLDSCYIFMNNLFTPNGDIYNETFPVQCDCPHAEGFKLRVKNKFKTLFETIDPQTPGWDGTYNGEDVKEGVYDYELQYQINGIPFDTTGKITLIRDISKPIKMNNHNCHYILTDPIMIQ